MEAPGAMYTPEEQKALKGLFALFDAEGSGFINSADLEAVLEKIGRDPSEADTMLRDVDPTRTGKISFEQFMTMLAQREDGAAEEGGDEGADPKVLEFLRILDEYRQKCEEEGNYMEAERATRQLETLRKQEERRQERNLHSKQLGERQDVQMAHNLQYAEFNKAWDRYLEEYDRMAQVYIKQMTERHAEQLREFQEQLHSNVASKGFKFSKELLDWRRRQLLLAKQKNYAEAQKIKRIADMMEDRERERIDEQNRVMFARKEAQLRKQQQQELAALLKRIEGRRREHVKQRALDSKRLLQRNRNVQQVLESRQSLQGQRRLQEIKSTLAPNRLGRFSTRLSDDSASPSKDAAGMAVTSPAAASSAPASARSAQLGSTFVTEAADA